MPRNRKCYLPNSLIELCFRAEEGLPLVATPYVKAIALSVLARAQSLYPVGIVAYVVMGNHVHMLLVVENPANVPGFKEYLKRELSHAINDFLGRTNRTVWVDGCDDPVILDAEKAMDRLVYVYTNPQKAGLVEKIEDYPNLSSWEAFLNGGSRKVLKRIPRYCIPQLPKRAISFAEQQAIADKLLNESHEEFELVIDPNAWIDCFPELDDADTEALNAQLLSRIRAQEQDLNHTRTAPVIGAHVLKLQSMTKPHTPQKRSKRMLCLATLKAVRKRFIRFRKERDEQARQVYRRWYDGENAAQMPPGMFWPGGRLVLPCEITAHCFCAEF